VKSVVTQQQYGAGTQTMTAILFIIFMGIVYTKIVMVLAV
jgi:hypothetical protein